MFYSHVNYSVTKIVDPVITTTIWFYSHVNYSVTKIVLAFVEIVIGFTVT